MLCLLSLHCADDVQINTRARRFQSYQFLRPNILSTCSTIFWFRTDFERHYKHGIPVAATAPQTHRTRRDGDEDVGLNCKEAAGARTSGSGFSLKLCAGESELSRQRWMFEQQALQEYILLCCQNPTGGLLDKPGKSVPQHLDTHALCTQFNVIHVLFSSPS